MKYKLYVLQRVADGKYYVKPYLGLGPASWQEKQATVFRSAATIGTILADLPDGMVDGKYLIKVRFSGKDD